MLIIKLRKAGNNFRKMMLNFKLHIWIIFLELLIKEKLYYSPIEILEY